MQNKPVDIQENKLTGPLFYYNNNCWDDEIGFLNQ